MRNEVKDWVQEGRLCVWRYADARRQWRGWQWSADPAGARSLRNLLDRMHAGGPCYRTLGLVPANDAVLSVPGVGLSPAERCGKLRVDYQPGFAELRLEPDGEALALTVGDGRLRKLAAALTRVEAGEGDFSLAPSDQKRADHWLFWWMLGIEYHSGKRW